MVKIFMSSSDEFYDAESDTVEDLETPTVEAAASFIPVVQDDEQDEELPKPRLPAKEKPPRPPPPFSKAA